MSRIHCGYAAACFIMMCTFEVGLVEFLVEMLFYLVLEFYLLIYREPDGVGCSSFILLCMSVDFEADVSFKINGHTQQDKRTANKAIRLRTNQEIKFQYKIKQHLNQELYQSHLECAHHYKACCRITTMGP